MLTNKKGTVLVVAVTAMMIMIVIGLVCLQIYTNQSILDTYDQARKRTVYSAEGAIEMMKGYIVKQTELHLLDKGDVMNSAANPAVVNVFKGFLAAVTPITAANTTANWSPFSNPTASFHTLYLLEGTNFDGIIHPAVRVDVFLHRLTSGEQASVMTDERIPFPPETVADIFANIPNDASDNKTYRGYKIEATAYATHKTSLSINTITTTIKYYFYTKRIYDDVNDYYTNEIKWVGWRRD